MQDDSHHTPAGNFFVISAMPKGDPSGLRTLGFRIVETRALSSGLPVGHPSYVPRRADYVLFLPRGWTAHHFGEDLGGPIDIADTLGRFRAQYHPETLKFVLMTRYVSHVVGLIMDPKHPHFRRAVVRDRLDAPPMSFNAGPPVWVSPDEVPAEHGDDMVSYGARLQARAEEWLDAERPGWRDPTAFW